VQGPAVGLSAGKPLHHTSTASIIDIGSTSTEVSDRP
jgi:hypothetical protein